LAGAGFPLETQEIRRKGLLGRRNLPRDKPESGHQTAWRPVASGYWPRVGSRHRAEVLNRRAGQTRESACGGVAVKGNPRGGREGRATVTESRPAARKLMCLCCSCDFKSQIAVHFSVSIPFLVRQTATEVRQDCCLTAATAALPLRNSVVRLLLILSNAIRKQPRVTQPARQLPPRYRKVEFYRKRLSTGL